MPPAFGLGVRLSASKLSKSFEPRPSRFRFGLLLRPAIRGHLRRWRATSGRGSRPSRRSRRVTGRADRRLVGGSSIQHLASSIGTVGDPASLLRSYAGTSRASRIG
jgi:hypothetical protein